MFGSTVGKGNTRVYTHTKLKTLHQVIYNPRVGRQKIKYPNKKGKLVRDFQIIKRKNTSCASWILAKYQL